MINVKLADLLKAENPAEEWLALFKGEDSALNIDCVGVDKITTKEFQHILLFFKNNFEKKINLINVSAAFKEIVNDLGGNFILS